MFKTVEQKKKKATKTSTKSVFWGHFKKGCGVGTHAFDLIGVSILLSSFSSFITFLQNLAALKTGHIASGVFVFFFFSLTPGLTNHKWHMFFRCMIPPKNWLKIQGFGFITITLLHLIRNIQECYRYTRATKIMNAINVTRVTNSWEEELVILRKYGWMFFSGLNHVSVSSAAPPSSYRRAYARMWQKCRMLQGNEDIFCYLEWVKSF